MTSQEEQAYLEEIERVIKAGPVSYTHLGSDHRTTEVSGQ